MPVSHHVIDDIVIGTHKGIRRLIRGIDDGLTITQAWLTVKENTTKTDAQALLQKSITGTAASAGQILDDGAEGLADIIFYLYPTDTIRLNPRRSYPYDVIVKASDNKYYPVDAGAIITRDRVGRVTGV